MSTDDGLPETLAWDHDIRLLTNPFMMYDIVKVVGISGLGLVLLMAAIMLPEDGLEAVPAIIGIAGIGVGVVFVLALFVMGVFFLNKYPSRFKVDEDGAWWEGRSRRAKTANTVGLVAGVLTGNPGLAGASMIAGARNSAGVHWKDVARIKRYPRRGVITLMNSWRVVQRLYCDPAEFERLDTAVTAWWKRAGGRAPTA